MGEHSFPLGDEEFLEALVRCESFSGNEANAAQLVVEQMRALGYGKAYIDEVGNAIGIWGENSHDAESQERIMLVGHIDTVQGDIPVRREVTTYDRDDEGSQPEEVLFGRGAVDAKGPFAAFVQAVSRLPIDMKFEVVVIGAVEEEAATSRGAHQILEDFRKPAAVVIGEPSNTRGVTLGYKGRLQAELTVRQTLRHSAHPEESASDLLFRYYEKIKDLVEMLNSDKEATFDKLDCRIHSLNTESDGMEETACMRFGFRLGPLFRPMDLRKMLLKTKSELAEKLTEGTELSMSFFADEVPVRFDKRSDLARVFRNAVREHGLEPRLLLKTGTSDMNVLGAVWSCPMIAYGPGDSLLDHTPRERIRMSDYLLAIDVLESALREFCL